MFKKDKKKLEIKNTFLFGLIAGVMVLAVVFSLFLFAEINNSSKVSNYKKGIKKDILLKKDNLLKDDSVRQTEKPPATVGAFTGKVIENNDSLVTVEIYDDFECSFCLRYTNIISQMLSEYGDKVNVVLKHFPLTDIHLNAQKAAEAYECASEQGKKWEMHDKLFESQVNKNMSVETWKNDAVELGLDSHIFDECLDSDKYAEKVKNDKEDGKKKGVRGAPETFVNDEIIIGAAPYSALKSVIEKHLEL